MEDPFRRRRNQPPRRSGEPSASTVAIAVLLLIAAGLLAVSIVFIVKYNNASSKSSSGDNSCKPYTKNVAYTTCAYSSPKIPQLQVDTAVFITESDGFYGLDGLPQSEAALQSWSVFRGVNNVAQIRWYTSEEDALATWPLFALAVQVNNTATEVFNDPKVTTLEQAQARFIMNNVGTWLNETRINWYHNNFVSAIFNIGWSPHPVEFFGFDCFLAPLLWAGNTKFEQGMNIYIEQFVQTLPNWTAWMETSLAQGADAHVHANMTWRTLLDVVAVLAPPGFVDPVCAVYTDTALQTQCYALSPQVDAVVADWLAVAAGDYLTACETLRPDSAPGLGSCDRGVEEYQQRVLFLAESTLSAQQISDLGQVIVPALKDGISDAMARIGLTYNDYVACQNDLDDTNCYIASGSPDCPELPYPYNGVTCHPELVAFQWSVFGNISAELSPAIGYLGRHSVKQATDGSPSTYMFCVPPSYDTARALWREEGPPCTINWGIIGVNSNNQTVFDRSGAMSTQMHEGYPGHITSISLEIEVDCRYTNFSASAAWYEGYALFMEQVGFELGVTPDTPLGLYQDPWQQAGFYANRMLRATRLIVDPGLHALGMSYDECVQIFVDNALGADYGLAECYRYVSLPAQAITYMIGALQFEALRAQAEVCLGPAFRLNELILLFTKFGGLPLSDNTMERLVDTYCKWRLGDTAAEQGFGYQLFVDEFYAAAAPVIGPGRNLRASTSLKCNGGVAPSSAHRTQGAKVRPHASSNNVHSAQPVRERAVLARQAATVLAQENGFSLSPHLRGPGAARVR